MVAIDRTWAEFAIFGQKTKLNGQGDIKAHEITK